MSEDTRIGMKDIIPIVMMGCMFVIIHTLALMVAVPFEVAGMEVFDQPDDLINIVFIFVILLLVTGVILVIAKYWKKLVIQFIILGAVGYTAFIVFFPILNLFMFAMLALAIAAILAIILIAILFLYPEWYVIDISGIIIGTGAIALFGISLGIALVIILLAALALYDAISVYKTKHMIDLADTVMDLKLPVLLIIPKIPNYSLLKETKRLKEKLKEGEERDAFFMGLGDVVMPGILVTAAYRNIPNGLPIVFSVVLGTLVGFSILMTFVMKGKPQAGLPLLCGGAIGGYLISSYVLYGELVGLTLPW